MPDADTEEGASSLLRCTVMDPEAGPVGKAFAAPLVELALASYPGFTMTAPPGPPSPYGVDRPEYVDRSAITHTVVHADGRRQVITDPTEFSTLDDELGRRPSPALPGTGRLEDKGGCPWARSSTPGPATRAATPTSVCGS